MANAQGFCNQAKVDFMNGLHAFGTSVIRAGTGKDTFNIALFKASASPSRGVGDTVYNTTGELAVSGNYAHGGIALATAVPPTLSGAIAVFTPSTSAQWNAFTSSDTFDCAVINNATSGSKLQVSVHTFAPQNIVTGTFTLTMPANDASNALIRFG